MMRSRWPMALGLVGVSMVLFACSPTDPINGAATSATVQPDGSFYVFPDIRGTGMTAQQFADYLIENYQVGVVAGTAFGDRGEGHIRLSYGAQKLIRPIQRRGTATRYGRNDLMLLLGLARLKSDETSTLADKKGKLEAMGAVELERWLSEGPLPDPAAQALGLQNTSPSSVWSAAEATRELNTQDARFEHWQRIPLVAGLDLMFRADANKSARVAAQRIYEQFVAATGEEPSERTITAIGEAKSGEALTTAHLHRLERIRTALGERAASSKLLLFGPSIDSPLRRSVNRRADVELIDLERLYGGS